MAGSLLSAELAATCNAIGFYDGNKYHLEPHSKETIKDLIRYLRRDEDSHDIRRFLGNSKILKTDLLPILQFHAKEKDLFDLVLRLAVNLSTPALIVYNEVVPTDKVELNLYLQIVSHLQSYKEAFTDHKSWTALTEQLSILLNKNVEARDDDDQRTIERILILIRNVLHVPSDALSEGRPDNDASVHDQVIWALHQSSMLDLLLYMASSSQESGFFMHLLEIICLMVREQPPSLLAQTAAQRSDEEKNQDEAELINLRRKEQQIRQSKTRQYLGSRHSNFGGTFIIKNMKSTTDSDLIYHKPLQKVNHFSLDTEKKKVKIPKNRLPLKCGNVERRSALSVRLILKQFCVEILNAAYNPLMRHIKDCLTRGKTQDNDESYYFSAMKFFMEFNRMYKFQVKLVSETMSVETFHFLQKNLETWHEMMVTDKKKVNLWSARLHLALKAYKELLQNLASMDASPDSCVRESSKVIKSNVFYVVEYREMLLLLINSYKKSKYSKQYLVDLIETTHIFLKLLSKFCVRKKIIVQKRIKPRKTPKTKKMCEPKQTDKQVDYEELWKQISHLVDKFVTSPITKEVIPFDVTSGESIEEQKIHAMKRIKMLMMSGDIEESVALLRASREVWPENDCFGKTDLTVDEEKECLKEVFFAPIDVSDRNEASKENYSEDEAENENNNGSDEDEEACYPSVSEQTVDFLDLVKRFASPRVMGVCITLLNSYETNSHFTNHCLAKMLHRIAWDCKLPSMLFQASLFIKFKALLESNDPSYKELAGLAIYTMRKFAEVAATNKKVLMELLFYKTAKEAFEIECGYGSFQKSTVSNHIWEDHEEDELKRLHKEYLDTNPSEDMVTWISENLINEKSRRIVTRKMKELGLVIAKTNKKGNVTSWTEEQEDELRNLYNAFKTIETDDVLTLIMEKLGQSRTRRNIASTLVRMGCAENTKVFRKKRKTDRKKKTPQEGSSDSESNSSEDDDDNGPTTPLESREQVRTKEATPYLYQSTKTIFSEKASHPYLVNGLRWLNTSMTECLEDIDDEIAEVPLLPLSNESILSIENKNFQCLLSALGVFKPLHQELYWRFPADWKENDFKKRMNFLELIINYEAMEGCLDYITSLIKEITGEDPKIEKSDEERDNDNVTIPPNFDMEQDPLNSKSKLKQSKNKLLTNQRSEIETKLKSKPIKKSKTSKNWQMENFDNVSTEDFNEIINKHCRAILCQSENDGPSIISNNDKGIQNFSKKKVKMLEDSHSETEELHIQIPKKNLISSKEKENQSDETTINTVHNSFNRPHKSIDTDSEIDYDNDPVDGKHETNTFLGENSHPSLTLPKINKKKRSRLIGMLVDSDSETEDYLHNCNQAQVNHEFINDNKKDYSDFLTAKRPRVMSSDSETEIENKTIKKKHVVLSDDDD